MWRYKEKKRGRSGICDTCVFVDILVDHSSLVRATSYIIHPTTGRSVMQFLHHRLQSYVILENTHYRRLSFCSSMQK